MLSYPWVQTLLNSLQVKDFDGSVYFYEKNYGYSTVDGSFTIKDNGNNNYTFTIDGELYDGRKIKGSYKGAFVKRK
jgi:hypothetical protein